jgi:small subunit ribosomal protein S16
MLAIRLQRTGRKGHAQFRILVQDARRTPSSGRFVAHLGSYNPHTKELKLDKEKADYYLKNGARPSDRVAGLLQTDGIKLPDWVKLPAKQTRTTRKPEKLRKNQPKEEPKAEATEAPADATPVEAPAKDAAPATEETVSETPAEATESAEKAAEEPAAEAESTPSSK